MTHVDPSQVGTQAAMERLQAAICDVLEVGAADMPVEGRLAVLEILLEEVERIGRDWIQNV